ncbi:L-threonylcarbamoyladenylate synthase [Pararhodospirillum oryzae]|uniref:Threonylcarbamoyl-AMP synthase n=1 Tax=Pararhodospirillum oryzae TaxID=478448 RepID=A0A512HAM5_9PROT|nr:L-threonylcarbamoyladenylate synthase [Pararhodospirillum oryzae]GEO82506.1 threonylcarbamoyl-AMP synthase [Pararhodospirillum oryzae]
MTDPHEDAWLAGRPDIVAAARILAGGGLVAFPTETVYGLGANARDDKAVARIFEAKGRPRFNPLIVHLPDAGAVAACAVLDARARRLAEAFWPGPLTMVLPRRPDSGLGLLVSAGLDTVGVRVPAHPLARALLRAAALPVAAPSANLSGTVSPTTAAHVREGLGSRVDWILEGGPCQVGLESTIVDLTTAQPVLLRPGAITREALAQALGEPVLHADAGDENAPRSPGRLLRHYAPTTPVRLNATEARPGEVLLGFGPVDGATLNLSPAGDLVEAAANLFAMLRALDHEGARGIAVSPVPAHGLGEALNDRLRRAAHS